MSRLVRSGPRSTPFYLSIPLYEKVPNSKMLPAMVRTADHRGPGDIHAPTSRARTKPRQGWLSAQQLPRLGLSAAAWVPKPVFAS